MTIRDLMRKLIDSDKYAVFIFPNKKKVSLIDEKAYYTREKFTNCVDWSIEVKKFDILYDYGYIIKIYVSQKDFEKCKKWEI